MTTIENACKTPMTPCSAEVNALSSGTWHLGWTYNTWTPVTNFEQLWTLAQTTQARALLLDTYFPLSSETLTTYQRSILMSVNLPATKSSNLAAELTFCDGTIRQRVCGFAYCMEDTLDGEGYWYCDECRKYGEEQDKE